MRTLRFGASISPLASSISLELTVERTSKLLLAEFMFFKQLSPSGFHVDFRSTAVGATLSQNVADADNGHLLLLGTDHSRASRGSSLQLDFLLS